jgi:hypothetical protein
LVAEVAAGAKVRWDAKNLKACHLWFVILSRGQDLNQSKDRRAYLLVFNLHQNAGL